MNKILLFLLATTISKNLAIKGIESKMEIQKNNSPELIQINREIKIGKIYRHYSGKMYKVIAIAHDSEDPYIMRVIYEGLYNCPTFGPNPIWDRPYNMFAQTVIIDGKEVQRFEEMPETL